MGKTLKGEFVLTPAAFQKRIKKCMSKKGKAFRKCMLKNLKKTELKLLPR